MMSGPELEPSLQVRFLQGWAEDEDHLPSSAANTPPNAAWENPIGLLCWQGTLLAHIPLGVLQSPQVLFFSVAFQLGVPQYILLQSCSTSVVGLWHMTWHFSHSSQFVSSANLLWTCCPLSSRLLMKMLSRLGPIAGAWRALASNETLCHWSWLSGCCCSSRF